ncbi:MAG: DUF2971 domain-containing protein [Pseudomonadota bacterium]
MDIFYPHAVRKYRGINERGSDFAHYTSASNAMRILENQQFTLRNALEMNDFSEISYGTSLLSKVWRSEIGVGSNRTGRLAKLLDGIQEGISTEIEARFDDVKKERSAQTFLLSLTEHNPESDDRYGRLSMWRAYGGKTNVALVLNRSSFGGVENDSALVGSPVLYADEDVFAEEFELLVNNLKRNEANLRKMSPLNLIDEIVNAMNMATLSTKHPGFQEERELRVLYAPWIIPTSAVEIVPITIDERPQLVCKVPLKNTPGILSKGATVHELLKKIIIGPTDQPYPLYQAFVHCLQSLGFPNAETMVTTSNIPIRR